MGITGIKRLGEKIGRIQRVVVRIGVEMNLPAQELRERNLAVNPPNRPNENYGRYINKGFVNLNYDTKQPKWKNVGV